MMGIDRQPSANERNEALQPIDFKGNTEITLDERIRRREWLMRVGLEVLFYRFQ